MPNEHNTWTVDDTHKSRSVDQSVSLPSFVEHAVRARSVDMRHTILQPLSPSAKEVCVYGTSVCMHSQHGSGAVSVASRKTGTVNLVVSRESGGAVRAPENVCDKLKSRLNQY